jgi:hypothetical protein
MIHRFTSVNPFVSIILQGGFEICEGNKILRTNPIRDGFLAALKEEFARVGVCCHYNLRLNNIAFRLDREEKSKEYRIEIKVFAWDYAGLFGIPLNEYFREWVIPQLSNISRVFLLCFFET